MILSMPIILYARAAALPISDWAEVDHGPGYVTLPPGQEYGFRARNISDNELRLILGEMREVVPLTYANLSENRSLTDKGLELLQSCTDLKSLNLSSCSLTNEGLIFLKAFQHLASLDLSYCNRITGLGLKVVRQMPALQNLNLQGCVKVTNGDVARLRRPGLTIKK